MRHQKNLVIMDLDGTAICSRHRQRYNEQGALDLQHWRENSTKEKVQRDSLLPVASLWRRLARLPRTSIAVCTARVIANHDIDFLRLHGLEYDFLLSRDGDHDTRKDADLKRQKLQPLIQRLQPRRIFLFDDNQSVLAMAASLGIVCIDSTEYNKGRAL